MNKVYKLEYDQKFLKSFRKLDKPIQKQILTWLHQNIHETTNPRWTGKGLTANKTGLWRYRIGKYRVIVNIHDDIATVLVLQAGKREIIYRT